MSIVWSIAAIAGIVLVVSLGIAVYLAAVLNWQGERTVGLSYYALPQEERTRFRERLKFHAGLLRQEE